MTNITFVTNADLGSIPNLNTQEAEVLIQSLRHFDENLQVICRDIRWRDDGYETFLPFGNIFPKALLGLKLFLFSWLDVWSILEGIFDGVVNKKIRPYTNYLVNFSYSLIASQKKISDWGGKTIYYAPTAHPLFNQKISRERCNVDWVIPVQKMSDFIAQSDYVFSLSGFATRTYCEYGVASDKIKYVGMWIDTDRFAPNNSIKGDIFRVVCVADFTPLKGLRYLLKAWDNLGISNGELVIVGHVPDHMKWSENRPKNVQYVWHTDPLPFYQSASVLVHPSLSDAFGKVVIEGMSCWLPVIVTDHTGASDFVREWYNGFVIPICSHIDIEAKLRFLYTHPEERIRMSERAREVVETECSLSAWSKRIQRVLTEIIQ